MSRRPPVGRLRGILAFLLLALVGVAARVSALQFGEADVYEALAHDQRVR